MRFEIHKHRLVCHLSNFSAFPNVDFEARPYLMRSKNGEILRWDNEQSNAWDESHTIQFLKLQNINIQNLLF